MNILLSIEDKSIGKEIEGLKKNINKSIKNLEKDSFGQLFYSISKYTKMFVHKIYDIIYKTTTTTTTKKSLLEI